MTNFSFYYLKFCVVFTFSIGNFLWQFENVFIIIIFFQILKEETESLHAKDD